MRREYRHTSQHVRHARVEMHVGVANPRCRGKRSRRSRRMHNPQFYVSGKRPMQDEWALIFFEISATCATSLLNTNVFSCFWYNLHDKGLYLPVMNQCWFIQWVRIAWKDMNPYIYSLFLTIPIFQFVGQVYSFFYKCFSWIYIYTNITDEYVIMYAYWVYTKLLNENIKQFLWHST